MKWGEEDKYGVMVIEEITNHEGYRFGNGCRRKR